MALPMAELAEVATPVGVEVAGTTGIEVAGTTGIEVAGTAGVEVKPICVAPGRPTTGVDEARLDEGVEEDLSVEDDDLRVVLEEVRTVLLGLTPMPPAALLLVFPASG
jgi:hypothetical protein